MPILRVSTARIERDRDAGFTLIEVIISMLILSLLAGIVGFNVRQAVISARLDAAKAAVEQIVRTTRAQSTFLGEFVSFDFARRGHPHEKDEQTIFFDASAGAGPDGVCPPSRGRILFDGQAIEFIVTYYTCEIVYLG